MHNAQANDAPLLFSRRGGSEAEGVVFTLAASE